MKKLPKKIAAPIEEPQPKKKLMKKKPTASAVVAWAEELLSPPAVRTEDAPELAPAAPAHALLSPSYSKTWLNCAASLAAGMDEPNTSSAAALEGTMCHAVLECCINRLIWDEWPIPFKMPADLAEPVGISPLDYVNTRPLPDHPKMVFDADQAQLLLPFVQYIEGLLKDGYTVFPEIRLNLSTVLGVANQFGTADLIAFKDDHLIVGDLKMGRHAVSPGTLESLNSQMGIYGAGALAKWKSQPIERVSLLIAQPRAGGLKFLNDIPAARLREFGEYARQRGAAALECVSRGKSRLTKADFTPTPDGCEWCRFRDKCSVKLTAAAEVKTIGIEITDAELYEAWKKLPLLESQIKSTHSQVMARLMSGRTIGDLRVVRGSQGNRAWADPKEAEKFLLGELYAKAYDKKIISPTAAAKLITDPEKLAVMNQLISRKEAGPAIGAADDSRPAYESVSDDELSD